MERRGDESTVRIVRAGTNVAAQATFSCSHCGMLSIATLPFRSASESGTPESDTWWANQNGQIRWTPETIGGREYPDVPAHVSSAADEAHRCYSIGAFRAAILLARAVVEATAKDNGVTKGLLAAKIDAMHDGGIIRSFTKDAAHELRYLGNDMAHGDFVETVDDDDASAVLAVMAEILNEVYQGPARVAAMRSKRLGARDEAATTSTALGG